MKKLGLQVQALRTKHGMSQQELADKIGVTQGMISQIEMNTKSVSWTTGEKLANVFGMTILDLESYAESEPAPPA